MDKKVMLLLLLVLFGVVRSVRAVDRYIDPAAISATASSINYQLDPVYTCNGNGLTGDLHTNQIGGEPPPPGQGTMWLSNGIAGEWIEYEFDKPYSINTMWVWNYNQITPSGGDRTTRGTRECTIEYSLDGGAWDKLGGMHTFAKADGSNTYAHNTEVDFGGVKARYVKITVISNHGRKIAGLSEVRFYAGDSVGFETEASSDFEGVTPAEIAVVLTNGQAEAVTIDYAVSGGTATAGQDFTLAAGTLVFNPGETAKTISINIVNDGTDEDDETIELTLSNLSGGEVELGTAEHIYTIIDPRPKVSFDTESSSGLEDVTPAQVSVTVSPASAQPITVDYSVTGGTATGGGVDYTLADGTLTFQPGETLETINIDIVDDNEDESPETIELALSNPINGTLGVQPTHTHTILDSDVINDSRTMGSLNLGKDEVLEIGPNGRVRATDGGKIVGGHIIIHGGSLTVDGRVDFDSAEPGLARLTINAGTARFNGSVKVPNDAQGIRFYLFGGLLSGHDFHLFANRDVIIEIGAGKMHIDNRNENYGGERLSDAHGWAAVLVPAEHYYEIVVEDLGGSAQEIWAKAIDYDCDDDGILNDEDNCPCTPNPDQADIDNDDRGDVCDNCLNIPNYSQEDADGDCPHGLYSEDSYCEGCPFEVYAEDPQCGDTCDDDADNDGIANDQDNCPTVVNPGQEDEDGDDAGDVCDNCLEFANSDQSDIDEDEVGDSCDNCPDDSNGDQADADSDDVGDVCDNCPDDSNGDQADADGDDVGDVCDNCPSEANTDQDDINDDGEGNLCDPDMDGDGVENGTDNCPEVANADQADSDSDGAGDACDIDLKVDLGCPGNASTLKQSWIAWELNGGCDGERHDGRTITNIAGTGINATITVVGNRGDGNLLSRGGDPIANTGYFMVGEGGGAGDRVSLELQFTGLPRGAYELYTYHSWSGLANIRSITISGEDATELVAAINVPIQDTTVDDELQPSLVKFSTKGTAKVTVRYQASTTLATVNAFRLVSATAGCACPGNLNDDQQIDLEDLQALAGILLNVGSPFVVTDPPECANLNDDTQADLDDLQALAAILLNAGSPFVAPCP